MIPELKIGIVVLASMVEHAQYVAQRLTGVLLPVFDAYFRSQPSAVVIAPPFPLARYVGTYTSLQPDAFPDLSVTLSWSGSTLLIDFNRSRLKFESVVDGVEGVTHLFRLLPWEGEGEGPGAKSCSETQMDDWYELIKFHVTEDGSLKVASVTMDFQYGAVWHKRTPA